MKIDTKIDTQQIKAIAAESWRLIRETQENLKELSISQKDTERIVKETTLQMKETDKQIKDTDKKTKEEIEKLTRQINKTEALFNTKWGKLVESLVEGKLVKLLQAHEIDVTETCQRVEISRTNKAGEIQQREIDIIAANGTEVVAVEVKTTLTPEDVKYFMSTLQDFKFYLPRYKNETVYGAVAYLRSESKASLFAERQGLFVIRATGDSASLINKPNFKPKAF